MASRISIPTPCPASWADMTPAPGGRHCAACNKVVVDFSGLSNEEVLTKLRQASGQVCGRFRPEQVSPATVLHGSWARWLAAAVVALSSCEKPNPAEIRLRQSPKVSETSSFSAQGRVLDQATGQPIAGARVVCLADSTLHATTTADGQFSLLLPAALRDSLLIISGSLPDYQADAPFTYFGRRSPAAKGMVIRLRRYEIPMLLGEAPMPEQEAGEVSPASAPVPKLTKIQFVPPVIPSAPE